MCMHMQHQILQYGIMRQWLLGSIERYLQQPSYSQQASLSMTVLVVIKNIIMSEPLIPSALAVPS